MGNIESLKAKFDGIRNISLTSQQAAAVTAVNGKVLLLAVPGSGKTTVLIMRLGYMLYECGISPDSVLTMTYTVAATEDMKRRFATFFGEEDADRVEFRTINSVCVQVLKAFERLTGRQPFELIGNERILNEIAAYIIRRTLHTHPDESDITDLRREITYIKNMQLTDEEIDKLGDKKNPVGKMYRAYCDEMKRRKWMDYDDQMVYALSILKSYPAILREINEKYKYICVDEAQDTSKIQHTIIALLAEKHGNLFMVGDEDQSIYGFRAAYPEALVNFERNHENATVLYMEVNFRSDGYIVAAADRFINKNMFRHRKTMISSFASKQNISVPVFLNRTEQYDFLLKLAQNHTERTAVLYRNNDSVVPIVDLFERQGITYSLRRGDTAFFTSRIVRDVTDIINFALNGRDTELFKRLYFKLGTYLSKEQAERAIRISLAEEKPVLKAAISIENLNASTCRTCKEIDSALSALSKAKGCEIIGIISYSLNYRNYLSKMSMDAGKLQLLSAVAAHCDSAQDFLTRLDTLKEIIVSHENTRGCDFILSTIHSAKGLEYDHVYLCDVCEGVLPECLPPVITRVISPKAAASPTKGLTPQETEEMKKYEEERRLFYVGMTRAKKSLSILAYKNAPSSFVDEVYKAIKGVSVIQNPSQSVKTPTPGFERKSAKKLVSQAEIKNFRTAHPVGARILHKKFGVLRITAWNDNLITVRSEDGSLKTLDVKTMLENNVLTEL